MKGVADVSRRYFLKHGMHELNEQMSNLQILSPNGSFKLNAMKYRGFSLLF